MAPQFNILGFSVSFSKMGLLPAQEVRSAFSQSGEDLVLLRMFDRQRGGFYVDVGAFHPRAYSNTYLLHRDYGWSGINIDASKQSIELFDLERPADKNVAVAIGPEEGESKYWRFSHPARNTLSPGNVQRQLRRGGTQLTGEETVRVLPLYRVLAENLLPNKTIDFLNVDVEGVEIGVLKSNDWDKYRPKIIAVEDYSLLTSGFDASPIYQFLSGQDYRLRSHLYDTSLYCANEFQLPGES